MNAENVLDEATTIQDRVEPYLRDGAEFFHAHEGEMFERATAVSQLAAELSVSERVAKDIVAQLVGDTVDPVIQVVADGSRSVGIVSFEEFDGAYGYVTFDDVFGRGKRVVCQQCVNEATTDTNVTHATENDPHGSFADGATWDELVAAIHTHYDDAHQHVPEDIETGATLASGTTIGTNTAWHAGNQEDIDNVLPGTVYITEAGASDPTQNNGDLWFEYETNN